MTCREPSLIMAPGHARYCVPGIIELNFSLMLNKFKLYSFNLKINILNRYFSYSSSLGTQTVPTQRETDVR